MKAFLSHSSKDKDFVRKVADLLGKIQCEYDEYTFESTLNVQAIRRALSRCDLFVLFLSANSSKSSYVTEEQRAALEGRGKGFIKRVLVFSLDDTSYKSLPNWLQEINVIARLSSSKACARRIQSTLIELDAEAATSSAIYLGRDEEEVALRRALRGPPGEAPIAIHVVGHLGIGRRTFLKKTLSRFFPGIIEAYLDITLSRYQGADDFFRSLYALHRANPVAQTAQEFEAFSKLTELQKIESIARIIIEISENNEMIVVVDEGGVYDDAGEYHPYLLKVIESLASCSRPVLGFIQTRMMPLFRRAEVKSAYHVYLKPLADEATKDLLSLSLKQEKIDFTTEQLDDITSHLDGHPYNARFAVEFIKSYGIDGLIMDPSELIDWKRRRAEDFLKQLKFNEIEVEIIAVLSDYRYMAQEMLVSVVDGEPLEVATKLRRLEEYCCIERREGYFHISVPIRDAVARDKRFIKPQSWRQSIGAAICDAISDYQDDDHVPVAIIESATFAAAHGARAPALIANMILPSHLLRIARDHYDRARRSLCMEFCSRAYQMKDRLTVDAQVEVLRLWGLSAVRSNDVAAYNKITELFSGYSTKVSRRVSYFLQGFYLRVNNRIDEAEKFFLKAWDLGKQNESINRELASLYCKQKRYNEAEMYARAAYEIAPTNPFIIDIMVETLLGKLHFGLTVDPSELSRLMADLKIYGDAPGSSFFLIRDAQRRGREGDLSGALTCATRAIERTPALLAPYFIRAEIHLKRNDIPAAEQDLAKINALLEDISEFSEKDEAHLHELEANILIERKQFAAAKKKIDQSAFLPRAVSNRLLQTLARTVAFTPEYASDELKAWARSFGGSVKPGSPTTASRRSQRRSNKPKR
jgi:tetratricopeptide (TPR) repeat protein